MHRVSNQPDVTLRLPRSYIGQTLDALTITAEQWEATHQFLATERIPDDIMIRDCDDPREAAAIARFYRDIIRSVESQLPKD